MDLSPLHAPTNRPALPTLSQSQQPDQTSFCRLTWLVRLRHPPLSTHHSLRIPPRDQTGFCRLWMRMACRYVLCITPLLPPKQTALGRRSRTSKLLFPLHPPLTTHPSPRFLPRDQTEFWRRSSRLFFARHAPLATSHSSLSLHSPRITRHSFPPDSKREIESRWEKEQKSQESRQAVVGSNCREVQGPLERQASACTYLIRSAGAATSQNSEVGCNIRRK
jgi:hypothetical protein